MLAGRFCLPPHYVSAPRALTMDLLLCLGRGVGGGGSQTAIYLPSNPEPRRVPPGPARLAEVGLGFCLLISIGMKGDPQGDMSKSSPPGPVC